VKPLALLVVGALACAHARPQPIEIRDPMIVTAAPPPAPIGEMDEATLFDAGTRAWKEGDFARSARVFDELVQRFPGSRQLAPALWNAALAEERLGRYAEALSRLSKYLLIRDEPQAQLHAAYAEYQLHRLDAAAARLHALAPRPGLSPLTRAEVELQEGICRIEMGARPEGEALVREAMATFDKAGEPAEASLFAQAEFWLGEAERAAFKAVLLDPSSMTDLALERAVDEKSKALLAAQDHYLRAIHKGDGEWATAAGFRIGEMYEGFYDELVHAPLPPGLSDSQRALYIRELHARVRALLDKAVRAYEQTLDEATQTHAAPGYRQKTEDALARLRKLLLESS
jgi:tetratricopeptide (TPR) repeat protein